MGLMQGAQSDERPRAGRVLALLAALACACALALGALAGGAPTVAQAATAPTSFKDVASGSWYYEWVTYAAKNGLMTGMKDARGNYTGYFDPEGQLTRAQVATVLWRLSGSPSAASAGFPDVKSGDWYATAVNYCKKIGVVTGYTAGTDKGYFRPDRSVTREELATMVWRYAKYKGIDVSNPTTDAYEKTKDRSRVTSYAVEPLTWTAAVGLMSGVDYGWWGLYLEPQGTATRGQAAKVFSVLHRDILTGKVTTPHPHTAQLYVYGSSDGVPIYTNQDTFIFVKSDDAASISEADLKFDAEDGSVSQGTILLQSFYADVVKTNALSNVDYLVNRVNGGFFGSIKFSSAGTKTLRLKENGKVIATLKVNVADGAAAQDAWINKVLASVTNSSMNSYEKFIAVVEYLKANFQYSTVNADDRTKYIHLVQYEVPYWVSYRWNSAISPAVLCKFAEKIGGLSPHNCYFDGDWNWHAYITITWNGKTEHWTVCPASSTGVVSYTVIDFTNLDNLKHFNPDAIRGLKKVAALSDDFEVPEALSADDGATYDDVTFDAVTDDAQAATAGGAETSAGAGAAAADGSASFDAVTSDADAGTGDAGAGDAVTGDADAAGVAGATISGDADAGSADSSGTAQAPATDAGSADASETPAADDASSGVAFEDVATPAADTAFDEQTQLIAA